MKYLTSGRPCGDESVSGAITVLHRDTQWRMPDSLGLSGSISDMDKQKLIGRLKSLTLDDIDNLFDYYEVMFGKLDISFDCVNTVDENIF